MAGSEGSRASQVQGITTFFLILAWLFTSARCYVKIFMTGTFGKEDWFAIITLMVFTVYSAFQLLDAATGLGQHIQYLTIEDIETSGRWWYCCEISYVAATTFVKCCIAVLLLRICVRRAERIVIWTVVIAETVFATFYFFLLIFQCSPVSLVWLQYQGNSEGHCVSSDILTDATWAHSALNAAADWTLCLIPISVVWSLQMNRRTKISVCGILGLGVLSSVATIVRIPYIYNVSLNQDFMYNITDIAIWSNIETGTSIVAASMVSLKPLFRAFLGRSQNGVSTSGQPSRVGIWTSSRAGYMRNTHNHTSQPKSNSVEELRMEERVAASERKGIQVITVIRSESNHGSATDLEAGDGGLGLGLGQQRSISAGALGGKSGWKEGSDSGTL